MLMYLELNLPEANNIELNKKKFIMKIIFLIWFAFFFVAINQNALSQSSPDKVVDIKVKVPKEVSKNNLIEAEVILQIKNGWHINSNKPLDESLTPTVVSLKDTSSIKILKTIYPEPILTKLQFSQTQMALYEDEADVKIQFRINKGLKKQTMKIRGEVQFQPCDNQTCLFPTSKPFEFELKFKK